jgi:hypothetical protein
VRADEDLIRRYADACPQHPGGTAARRDAALVIDRILAGIAGGESVP